ncbi:hypothetical protein C8Q79DRAFT_979040 [Trametes meyenii]|nr:hypothetical protein C8Q79DRAFT_979040 [Trametes meyenii]
MVLIVTVGGTLLALVSSGLPQWREEKYAARKVDGRKGNEVVCITRGNGSTFAMVVISDPTSIRLEDLAGGRDKRRATTSAMTVLLCVLWIVLLLTVEGLQGGAWYLLAVGGLGMVQNAIAAGAQRSAAALGFHFQEVKPGDTVHLNKVMGTLMAAEEKEPGVGLCMLPLFFPGDLRPDEQKYWDKKKEEKIARMLEMKQQKHAAKPSDPFSEKPPLPRTTSPEGDLADVVPAVTYDAQTSLLSPPPAIVTKLRA